MADEREQECSPLLLSRRGPEGREGTGGVLGVC